MTNDADITYFALLCVFFGASSLRLEGFGEQQFFQTPSEHDEKGREGGRETGDRQQSKPLSVFEINFDLMVVTGGPRH